MITRALVQCVQSSGSGNLQVQDLNRNSLSPLRPRLQSDHEGGYLVNFEWLRRDAPVHNEYIAVEMYLSQHKATTILRSGGQ
jgi:hypothetical protein